MNLRHSHFKNNEQDFKWFKNWVHSIEQLNNKTYDRIEVSTILGKTHVWGINTQNKTLPTLIIFPGARTSSLFWDFDNGLENLGIPLRIFLVETNGLPNLSDGNTPNIKSLGYGEWASELFEKLNIQQAFVAGASFGGLICMKLSIVSPEKVKACFLLNPGCLQPFSLSFKNLYYNLLPIISPTAKHVASFLDTAVFCKPYHTLSKQSEKLIIDYEVFALTRYVDRTQKPYYMNDELSRVTSDTYLLVGDKDLLFPYQKSIKNAEEKIRSLKNVNVFQNVGHGIETYAPAMQAIGKTISEL